jgi:hypothetical protein
VSGVAGIWDVIVSTPFGDQDLTIDLVVDGTAPGGTAVSGVARHAAGTFPFEGGTLKGHTVTFRVSMTAPVTADLKVTLTADGDTISGKAKAGLMPSFAVHGRRAE